MVSVAGPLIEASIPEERSAKEIWERCRQEAARRTPNTYYDRNGNPSFAKMTARDQMRMAQMFLVTAFMTPEIGSRFIEAIKDDPIAAAKLVVAISPKELHVEMNQTSGVVLLPMKVSSLEAWSALADSHSPELKVINPEDAWKDLNDQQNHMDDEPDPGFSALGRMDAGRAGRAQILDHPLKEMK